MEWLRQCSQHLAVANNGIVNTQRNNFKKTDNLPAIASIASLTKKQWRKKIKENTANYTEKTFTQFGKLISATLQNQRNTHVKLQEHEDLKKTTRELENTLTVSAARCQARNVKPWERSRTRQQQHQMTAQATTYTPTHGIIIIGHKTKFPQRLLSLWNEAVLTGAGKTRNFFLSKMYLLYTL